MRITKISIKDFRAFRGAPTEINLTDEGKNLLIYGENGSGKSSLYQALKLFFSSPEFSLKFEDHRHYKVTTRDGYVKIDIGDNTSATSKTYEWDETSNPFKEKIIVEASKTKGFLDYKALLETHFTHQTSSGVDLFNLLINSLLVNVSNPITRSSFQAGHHHLKTLVKEPRGPGVTAQIAKSLDDFNSGLVMFLNDLATKTNEILSFFENNTTIRFALPETGGSVAGHRTYGIVDDPTYKELGNENIFLEVDYYGEPLKGHHNFLNEARLSAIAISMYLAALLMNPQSQLRILFLDDVLLGLDMSNRLPLLEVLSKRFSDWQIFLTTYDHAWFTMVKKRVCDWKPGWEFAEFYCRKTDEGDIPLYARDRHDFLAIADAHLNDNDLKAAAIYVRSAYEYEMKHFADKHHLSIRYAENSKDLRAEYFWSVIKNTQLKAGGPVVNATIVRDVELFRSTILNELSHAVPQTLVRQEVVDAKNAILSLKSCLDLVDKGKI